MVVVIEVDSWTPMADQVADTELLVLFWTLAPAVLEFQGTV